ncbi:MAG: shikimate kinase AroK [Ectothiorhodospiraceae bacterium]|nr:shikimate kinase AroK [Ectothiorhodospiraceae bacterium]
MAQNIIFVGPMGAGKTTIGKALASQLGRTFYDSDREIEERTGANIPLIFELEGEEGFRRREQTAIAELMAKTDIVLATGGGAVLDPENRDHITRQGFVIYLNAPLEQLLKRTAKDKSRPLLQTADPRKKLQDILTIRDPLYREIADVIIETDGGPARTVVKNLLALIAERGL